ncbi:hypothetical protein G6W57_11510 [Streptomyces sp. CAI-121]|uniref:hypothetical protein n=1 Tax=unclassified Streptomyces TaxID=2593676 RepID=UPI001587487E|nr:MULTISPECIES: hypothetical protein [unclassified Streptomyces]NUV67739.1 hypothetical protein [Streptomyces sp. CAI-121]NUW13899.1 hypothetical protein [Streptomyces sp. CAI-68]
MSSVPSLLSRTSARFRGRRAAQPRHDRWNTWDPPKAEVLGVARTLTSATRVVDVMHLLRREDGIEKYYTVNPGSAFADGLDSYLSGLGIHVLSWEEATRRSFDLAVSCSVHPTMRRLDAPLMVLPHGAGYNRLVTESTGDALAPAGLSRRELMWRGKVVPKAIGVSHQEQIDRLAEICPEAAPYALAVGDWCFQRITASMSHRDRYRSRLGAVDGRRLVVVHSTWSEHSLLGRHPELPLRLVTSLPADEFAVAAVFHPNVWARHTPAGVLERLGAAVDAGLMIIPPQEGWRAAVVASDWVVGDHGSTSFYSAAADRVTMLAATGLDELDPLSPAAAFARGAPRLDPDGDVLAQLLDTARRHDPAELRPVVDGQLASVDTSGEVTRARMYEFLARRGVRVPPGPPRPLPVPAPEPVRRAQVTAYDVTGTHDAWGTVEIQRRPLVAGHHTEALGFYAVTTEENHPHWPDAAEVLARTVAEAEVAALDWIADAALRHENLNVLVARLDETRCLVRLRGGRQLEARTERAWGARRPALDPVLLGSAVNLWLTDPERSKDLTDGLTLRTGEWSVRVAFTPPTPVL